MKIPVIYTHKALLRINQLIHDQMREDSYLAGRVGTIPVLNMKHKVWEDHDPLMSTELCFAEAQDEMDWEESMADLKAMRFPNTGRI